jgi:hypothetical protein
MEWVMYTIGTAAHAFFLLDMILIYALIKEVNSAYVKLMGYKLKIHN